MFLSAPKVCAKSFIPSTKFRYLAVLAFSLISYRSYKYNLESYVIRSKTSITTNEIHKHIQCTFNSTVTNTVQKLIKHQRERPIGSFKLRKRDALGKHALALFYGNYGYLSCSHLWEL